MPRDREIRDDGAEKSIRRVPLLAAFFYGVVGTLWIAISSWLGPIIFTRTDRLLVFEALKGWIFVILTSFLLYVVLRAALGYVARLNAQKWTSEARLNLALSEGGGVWELDLATMAVHISANFAHTLQLPEDYPRTMDAWLRLFHPEDRRRMVRSHRAVLAGNLTQLHDIYRLRDGSGRYRWLQTRARVISDRAGQPLRLVGISLDVSQLKEAEAQLAFLSENDALTSLLNRGAFRSALARMVAQQDRGKCLLLIRLDMMRFREFNVTYGAEMGDALLVTVAARIAAVTGEGALVARFSADEFAVAIPDLDSVVAARNRLRELSLTLAAPFTQGERQVHVDFRYGCALFPDDGASVEGLIAAAGLALAQCKRSGSDTAFYARGMHEALRNVVQLGQSLRGATARGEFRLAYQPVVDLATGRTRGFEALLRWHHPEEGVISPASFIPIAEDVGLISEIGVWVLNQACADMARLDGGKRPFVAVNVSQLQLTDPQFVDEVAEVLAATGLAPDRLELEITETALARDFNDAAARLEPLRSLGVGVAIDDFGTGYSSLTALRHLPFTKLKLDRSFVKDYGFDSTCTAILDGVVGLAQSMALQVTAEGVETTEVLKRMQAAHCHHAQGFLFSPGLPFEEAAPLVSRSWF